MVDNRNEARTGIIAFFVGSMVGAAAGVLFAPKEGTETRRLIQEQTNKTVEGTRQAISDAQSSITQKIGMAKDSADGARAELDSKLDNVVADTETVQELQARLLALEAEQAKANVKKTKKK